VRRRIRRKALHSSFFAWLLEDGRKRYNGGMSSRSPEQYDLKFSGESRDPLESDQAQLEKIKEGMRKELAYKDLPPDDPVFDHVGRIRLERKKSGAPSVAYHDHFLD
jgi:hypothetical protein